MFKLVALCNSEVYLVDQWHPWAMWSHVYNYNQYDYGGIAIHFMNEFHSNVSTDTVWTDKQKGDRWLKYHVVNLVFFARTQNKTNIKYSSLIGQSRVSRRLIPDIVILLQLLIVFIKCLTQEINSCDIVFYKLFRVDCRF